MTSLKKKGVLSTEVGKDEDGNKFLQVTFTADGLDVVRELTAADESNTEEPEAECEPCDEAEVVEVFNAIRRSSHDTAAK